jgi:hypothetical protein
LVAARLRFIVVNLREIKKVLQVYRRRDETG